MSQEFVKFPKNIKSCSVVLERLDDKILSQYSQKYNIKMIDVIKHGTIYSNNLSDKSKGNRREIKKSAKMNKLKKRRRKIRVLSSSDDDESSNETSFTKQNVVAGGKNNSGKPERSLHDRNNCRGSPISNRKDADNEIEVIQEITKPCVLQKEQNFTSRKVYFEEDESDFREDNEDDKITVIFEESPNKNTMEIESFVEKYKNKISAVGNSELGEKIAEKSASDELRRENHLKRLCSLVKRLHELFRIISQLQQYNDDPGVHFSKVIKAQKTSFFKEIKMSQKPVIESYEKLLTFYENSSKVISKISQHTLLSLEDVSNIISRCLLLGKFHQTQKNTEVQPKNCRRVSDNFKKFIAGKRVSKNNQIPPQLYSFPPSEGVSYQYEIIPTADESLLPFVIPPEQDVVSHRSFLPPYNDYNMQKQNICAQQKSQNQVFDPIFRAPLQNDFRCASAVPDTLKRNVQYSYPQNMASNFLVSSPVSQKRPDPEFSAPVIPTHPFHVQQFYIPNCIQQKSLLEESPSNFGSSVQFAALRQRNNPHAFPLGMHKDVQRLAQHPLGDYVSDSRRLSKQNPYDLFASGEEILGKQRMEVRNNTNEVGQDVFNFTVPGYLPVKNYQNQGTAAGKATEENEGDSGPFQSLSELENCSGLRKENFRKYVCAQINCKMPGIRICKGCQSVIYCSETCQLKHWALKHKTECYQLRELRIS